MNDFQEWDFVETDMSAPNQEIFYREHSDLEDVVEQNESLDQDFHASYWEA